MKLTLLLLLLATSARAQKPDRWFAIAANPTYTLRVDKSTVVHSSPSLLRVWVKADLHEGQPLSTDDPRITFQWIDHEEVDCGARTMRTVSSTDYDQYGRVLFTFADEQSAFHEPVPDTIGDDIVTGVCKYFR